MITTTKKSNQVFIETFTVYEGQLSALYVIIEVPQPPGLPLPPSYSSSLICTTISYPFHLIITMGNQDLPRAVMSVVHGTSTPPCSE